MTEELKYQIVAAAKEYARLKKISNNDVAKISGINSGYISNMFRDQFTTTVEDKEIAIGDRWFYKLAEWAGLPIRKQFWSTVETPQFTAMLPALEEAKKNSRVSVLITPTGLGKTYIIDRFCHHNPVHTYRITVSSVHKLQDVLLDIIDALKIRNVGKSSALRMKAIINRLREIKQTGGQPIVIIDEAENLELAVLKMLKGLYDGVVTYASLVLIGTDQLIQKLLRLRKHDKAGIPQFYRRIKAGIRYIPDTKDFKPFFEKMMIADKGLRRLLNELCENYGELHDYLEPALREADELEQPLTENLFRMIYNMPKYN